MVACRCRSHPARSCRPESRSLAAQTLAVAPEHALAVADLPWHHRDPFDRLLIAPAPARATARPVLTADRTFEQYDVLVVD